MTTHRIICSIRKFVITAATVCCALLSYAEAAVTVIDFEEYEGSPNRTQFAPNFHGVTFSSDFGVWQTVSPGQAHSGRTCALANRITEGYKECTFTFTTSGRRFLGAWIIVFGDSVQFVLYKSGDVVGRSSVLSNTPSSTFLASSYDGPVDSVGVLGNRGYYGLDDLTWSDDPQIVCTPHAARGIAHLSGGSVTGASITDPGCGYTNAPLLLIQGGGGSGATATAVVTNGRVTAINIESSGCCYTSAPQIVIASPPFVPRVAVNVSRVRVTQSVVLGRRYVLDSSTNLVTWNVTGPPFTANSETIESEFDVGLTGCFFRLREVP